MLSQGTIPNDRPVAYASRTLNESESKYSTIEKELLSIVWACKYFRPYLFGRKFFIYTDHRPLTWLFNLKEPNSKLVRWRLRLEVFDFTIVYKKGKQNLNADALSRIHLNVYENESVKNNPGDSNQTITDYMQQFAESLENENNDDPELDPPSTSQQQNVISNVEIPTREMANTDDSTVHSEQPETESTAINILDEIINNRPLQFIIKKAHILK